MIDFLTVLHTSLSAVLLLCQFCRAVATNSETRLPILLSFYLLTVAAGVSLFAPLIFKGWAPSIEGVLLLSGICSVQIVTARYWKKGSPRCFQKDESSNSSPVDIHSHGVRR